MIDSKEILEAKKELLNNSERLVAEKDVIRHYGNLFNPRNLDRLTKEDFKTFLLIKNNRHWEGIHRQGNMITADMPKLIKGLKVLLNEERDLKERLDFLFPKNHPNYIKGLGRAIITPILMMVYPKKYGVFNSKSEKGLAEMGLLPSPKGKSFAVKYFEVNNILKDLAKEYGLTLWQLDEIVGWMALGNPPIGEDDIDDEAEISSEKPESYADFGLEAHLEEHLVRNWNNTVLGKNYTILEKDGDLIGQQYPTDTGRIDILAISKDKKELLVIELKKGRASDKAVGQIQRYMGYIKAELAEKNQRVSGLIISLEDDVGLQRALSVAPNINLMFYEVNFKLKRKK